MSQYEALIITLPYWTLCNYVNSGYFAVVRELHLPSFSPSYLLVVIYLSMDNTRIYYDNGLVWCSIPPSRLDDFTFELSSAIANISLITHPNFLKRRFSILLALFALPSLQSSSTPTRFLYLF